VFTLCSEKLGIEAGEISTFTNQQDRGLLLLNDYITALKVAPFIFYPPHDRVLSIAKLLLC